MWRVGHAVDKRGILAQVAVVGINHLEVLGCHSGFFAGGIFCNHLLVGGNGFAFLAHIALVDGKLQQTFACLNGLRIAAQQFVVGVGGCGIVVDEGIGVSLFEQGAGSETRRRELLEHIVDGSYLAVVVLGEALHDCLLVEGIVAGGVAVEVVGGFVVAFGCRILLGVVLAVGKAVVSIGAERDAQLLAGGGMLKVAAGGAVLPLLEQRVTKVIVAQSVVLV